MAAGLDVKGQILGHLWPVVVVVLGKLGESCQNVQAGDDPAVGLDGGDVSLDLCHQIPVNLCLKGVDAVFRAQNLLFIFLELLGDVAFGVDKRLLADPLRRNEILESVTDLDVVPENVVVTDFERGYSRPFGL